MCQVYAKGDAPPQANVGLSSVDVDKRVGPIRPGETMDALNELPAHVPMRARANCQEWRNPVRR